MDQSKWKYKLCMFWMFRWGSFERSDGIYRVIEMQRSYEMALKTWSDWLEIHINRSKTQLFFMTMSPVHERYGKKKQLFFISYDIKNIILLLHAYVNNPHCYYTYIYDDDLERNYGAKKKGRIAMEKGSYWRKSTCSVK